jgi:molecular chaperone DnaK (HSP70)
MAYVEPDLGANAPVLDFKIPQAVRSGEIASLELLPSCIYLPGPHEVPADKESFAWAAGAAGIVGEFARWQGLTCPAALLFLQKAGSVTRGSIARPPFFTLGHPPDMPKLSPVSAAARLLKHLALAWNQAHPGAPMASQEVVITVPASFDEVARALTVEAARTAGLENFTLLEEPQAAFYDFTARHRQNLAAVLEDIRLVLVVDVGGGTSDFTLVQTTSTSKAPFFDELLSANTSCWGATIWTPRSAESLRNEWSEPLAGSR